MTIEVNFDGLVGITHCYGGLSLGNIASMAHGGQISNPRQAALQGLEKMKFIQSLGVPQAVLPPHERPHLPTLHKLGFGGSIASALQAAHRDARWVIPQVSSSAAMWTANAATVSPSIDSVGSRLHITPANLASHFHRSIEAETTSKIFQAIFPHPIFFYHHAPLPSGSLFLDEGAANHMRFCKTHGGPGVHVFVYGTIHRPGVEKYATPKKFPARQSLEASEAVARLHRINPKHLLFAHQYHEPIDAGCFHNDVICLSNCNLLITHERAFFDQDVMMEHLKKKVVETCDTELQIIEIKESEIPLKVLVESYLFNSQLITVPNGSMHLVAPTSCLRFDQVTRFLKNLTEQEDNPVTEIHYIDLTQSMENGGGPACLRLRIPLTPAELEHTNPSVFLTETLYQKLSSYIHKYYPTSLSLNDLSDPKLYEMNCEALNELTHILNLGKIYSFQ